MNNKFLALTIVALTLLVASPALATTGSLNPQTVTVTPDKLFDVAITIDPQSGRDYAEKVTLNYPADLLEVGSFNFSGSWIPLTQTGYDTVDNANGTLTKTAGYPNGINSPTTFGTVTFKAKKAGNANISFNSASRAFQNGGQTGMTGNGAVVAIVISGASQPIIPTVVPQTAPKPTSAPKVVLAPVKTSAKAVTKSVAVAAESAVTTSVATTTAVASGTDTVSSSQAAAVNEAANQVASGGLSPWAILGIIVVVLLILYGAYKYIKR